MANKTNNRGGSGRPPKVSRTIDLEANPKEPNDDVISVSDDADIVMESVVGNTAPEAVVSEPSDDKESVQSSDAPVSDKEPATIREAKPTNDQGSAASAKTKKSSSVSLVASAVLGGVVALAGSSLLGQSSVLTSVPVIGGLFSSENNQQVELENLKSKVEELSGAGAALPAEVSDRLSALEGKISGLGSGSGIAVEQLDSAMAIAREASARSDAVSKQVGELNDKLLAAAANGGGSSVNMEAVKAALATETNQLAERLAAVEASAKSMSPAASDQLSGLSGEIGEIKGTIAAFQERVGALETLVNEKIMPSIASVEKAAEAAMDSQNVARSVSARALGAVLENGGAFASELASAEALMGQSPNIDALKALAQKGIRSEAELVQQFTGLAQQIQMFEIGAEAGTGIVDRFMASAKSLVTVRPAGPVEGNSDAAIVSRIEAALNSGDLASALVEWQKLSEPAKAVSKEWAQDLANRTQANRLIKKIVGELSANTSSKG